jgi:hypothetical protein
MFPKSWRASSASIPSSQSWSIGRSASSVTMRSVAPVAAERQARLALVEHLAPLEARESGIGGPVLASE